MSPKVVTFNASTLKDLRNTVHRLKTANDRQIQDLVTSLQDAEDGVLAQQYSTLSGAYIRQLLTHEPDVICLQELLPTEHEQDALRDILKKNGYTIVTQKDTAIAYRQASLRPTGTGEGYHGHTDQGAYYADLQTPEGVVVRVVSDHPDFGLGGADALRANLVALDPDAPLPPPSLWKRIYNKILGRSLPQSVIIYGLDANASMPNTNPKENIQPERLEVFGARSYTRVQSNDHTFIYHNPHNDERLPGTLDHIFFKVIGGPQATARVIRDPAINDFRLLKEDTVKVLPASDHLPVMTEIYFKDTWSHIFRDAFQHMSSVFGRTRS